MMKKLNQTWKQQKPILNRNNATNQKDEPLEGTTRKRFLGRIQLEGKISADRYVMTTYFYKLLW